MKKKHWSKTSIILMLFILSLSTVFPPVKLVSASNEAKLVTSYPKQNAEFVPISTQVTLQFDNTVFFVNKTLIKLFSQRRQASFIEEKNVIKDIQIIEDSQGRKNTLLITFNENLKIDHNYRLQVPKNSLSISQRLFRNDLTLNFSTSSYKFEEVMSGTVTKKMLADYAPRQIQVVTPKKYIETIDVIHKKSGTISKNEKEKATNAVTNIDITTKAIDVESARVVVWVNNRAHSTTDMMVLEKTTTKQTYHLGLADLPETFDIQIILYNQFSETIESKMFKVPEGGNPVFNIKETFKYKTDGKIYSLYELMANPNLFNDVLLEHDTFPLKVQLEEK